MLLDLTNQNLGVQINQQQKKVDFFNLCENIKNKTIEIPQNCNVEIVYEPKVIALTWIGGLKEISIDDNLEIRLRDANAKGRIIIKTGINSEQFQNIINNLEDGIFKQMASCK